MRLYISSRVVSFDEVSKLRVAGEILELGEQERDEVYASEGLKVSVCLLEMLCAR